MTSDVASRTGRVAAIYARVSSERQRRDETIQSQTVGLRELAPDRGLLVPEDLVFEDEGFSGATLTRYEVTPPDPTAPMGDRRRRPEVDRSQQDTNRVSFAVGQTSGHNA
jgi:Resolvase, N terminal domain